VTRRGLNCSSGCWNVPKGNAFFAEELLAAGGAQDAELPDSLRDLLLVTIDGLPPAVVAVLRIVAAAGGTARHGLVAQVVASGGSEPDIGDLDGAVRVAVEQGVLVADPMTGTYAFRHALLFEAVYSTLLPGRQERTSMDRTAVTRWAAETGLPGGQPRTRRRPPGAYACRSRR
jgi:hypothetical protein